MVRPAHLARAKAKHVTLSAIAVAAVAFLFFQWLMVPHPGSASNPGAPLMVPPAIHTKPYISDRSIYVNETVTVRFSMRRLSGSSGNGGITVSFPDLDQANSLQSSSSYASADGSVSTWSYTNGTSKVHYFPSGYSPIHLANGGTDIARYLIVETDDTDWPDTNSLEDHRTLELRVTPKREMTFRIYYRFWLCRSGHDDCARHPGSTRVDQQGWNVGVYYVTVRNRAPSVARVTPSASTVTLDPGDRQTFSARATDADANISEWDWFLDGVSQNGQSLALTGDITRTFSHTFPTAGRHTVQSKFTDLDGESASAIWTVRVPPPSVSVTVASRPSGRTVTVDGTARTTPYTVTWDSGSSHRLNVPYSQPVGQDRYVFSHWSHGGVQRHSVAPTRNTTYTANFTLQHFLSARTDPRGIGVPGGETWYDHNATVTVGPAPTIPGYVFSYWRKGGSQNIGSSPSRVTVRVDSSFLVEAVYVVAPSAPAIHTKPYISDRSIYVNETVTVRFSMRRLSGSSGNGGITVSFPDLDQANSLQSSSSYASADGSVSTWSYTNGTSKVHYFPSGYSPIHLANGGTDIARYLIVETDDTDWPDTNSLEDHRTLELRVTPKREMTFRIYYRFWLCRSGHDDCARHPGSTRVDQQGWNVGVYYVTVRNRAPSVARVTPSASTVTLDPGDRQTFSARATDADANISEWDWFLDGVSQNGQSLALTGDITRTFSHTFPTAGRYTVQSKFTDLDGESASAIWTVRVPPPSVSVTVASRPSGRTVTVDGTARTTPYTVTWDSGSSHRLNVPYSQLVGQDRYVFAHWSHGGSQSHSVAPTRNTTYTANFTLQHPYDGATRSFNPERVAPGGSVTVTIQLGQTLSIIEMLPDGFTYTGSSIDDPADDNDVSTVGQTVTFTPIDERSFTYTVTAPSTEGSHLFSGVARFDSDRNNDLPVGGASTVTVEAVIDEDTLIARYDVNKNGSIDRGEVIAAINDYLDGEGITRADVIRLINFYLDGPSTPPTPPGAPTGLTAAGSGQTRMNLSWSAPASDGRAAIAGYRIEVSEDRSTWNDLVANTRNAAVSYSHTGLTAGSTRHYRVSAINSAGTGPVSNIATGTTATTAGDAASDRAALVALYNATDGANWLNKDNWLSNSPMGDWKGVDTDSDGRVTLLDLRDNQLTGAIPAELGRLTNLDFLLLSENQLTGAIPAELGRLTNLELLYLNDNQLTGGIPAELGNLTNLLRLALHSNQLTGGIPAELGNLTNLLRLALHNSELTGAIPAELGRLTNLELLYLNDNQLTGGIPAELGSLTNLRALWLGGNQLTGEIPEELGSLTNLKYLDLLSNQLTGGIPAELGDLTHLERLNLSGNQLTGEIPAELGSLTNLERLYLNDNQLSGEIPAGLGSLTNLERLNLSGNQLTGEIPAELGGLTNLELLLLPRNQLTGEIPAELGDLTNLEWLYLSGNQLVGCIPSGLRDVPQNDLAQLRLDYCTPERTSPDLVASVTSVGDAGILYAGGSFTINAEVYNQGTGPSTSTTGLVYYRSTDRTITTDDTVIGTGRVDPVPVSGTKAESISSLTAPSSAGTYYYGVCVRPVDGESDILNNCSEAATAFVLEPAVVSSIECRVTPFGNYTIKGTVYAVTALSNVTVTGYGIDDFGQRTQVGEDDLGRMSARTSKSFSISGINRLYSSCEHSLEWEY